MDKEQTIIEVTKKPEAQENYEVSQSVESSEDLRQQMMSESEKETTHFKKECADDITQAEARAEKDGLTIDYKDKEELGGLSQEADVAKAELIAEIGEDVISHESILTNEQQSAFKVGKNRIMNLQSEGKDNTSEYFDLYAHLTEGLGQDLKWRNISEIDDGKVEKMLKAIEHASNDKNGSAMKERAIEDPELLSKKEASKKFLAEERKKLAEEIREQRRLQRDRLSASKTAIESATFFPENMEGEFGDKKFGQFLELQSVEANKIAERFSLAPELNEQEAQSEQENISQLIENSEDIKSIKVKIEEHYVKADAIARERFDTLNRSLEHVIKRNNVFIVHKIEEREDLRHGVGSNVSKKNTYQDDIDILLTFEPSISTSSVTLGEEAELWPGASGFLLGGGEIGEVGTTDLGTQAYGIKKRGGKTASIEEIDKIVGRQDEFIRKSYEHYGSHLKYNEVVVNNPEVFGFFQHVEKDEKGRCWAGSIETRQYSEEAPGYSNQTNHSKLKSIVDGYRERFIVAKDRGIPLYVMTVNREVYEYMGINDDGTIEMGKQLSPEEVATGRAGLLPEKRKEIGERLIERRLFTKQETNEEAREIIKGL